MNIVNGTDYRGRSSLIVPAAQGEEESVAGGFVA